jgi:hypothetical protein
MSEGFGLTAGASVGSKLQKVMVLAWALWLCGCAAREVTPVRITQPGDDSLTCSEMREQISTNQSEEARLLAKDKTVERGNAAKAVGSAIPYVGLAIAAQADLSNEEQVKARALADRDDWLKLVARKKGCFQ